MPDSAPCHPNPPVLPETAGDHPPLTDFLLGIHPELEGAAGVSVMITLRLWDWTLETSTLAPACGYCFPTVDFVVASVKRSSSYLLIHLI